ncbi:MAG: replicative DNA helicase, partial [Bacilli bacterium]|nr:replicative DNA helicase [Bacilli bacterium]
VAFLYRDSYYKKQGNEEGNANVSEVIIGKHRNGRTGTINLIFKGDTCSFLNYAKEEG